MKHIKYIIVIISLLIASFYSSCNYLNVEDYFDDTLSLDSVFANKRNIEKYMWGIASEFPNEGQLFRMPYSPGPLGSDEMCASNPIESYNGGTKFIMGEVNADNVHTGSNGNMSTWANHYIKIRRANTIFNRIDEVHNMTTAEKMHILGYTHFIRAYAYYLLLLNYGPVVLMGDEVMDNNSTPEYYDRSRATYDESIDYICEEFERAALYLPITVPTTVFGRPTKGAAFGLIARLRLQQASPAFNGGSAAKMFFGSWTRTLDGKHYISQTPDERKWAVAAAAAKRLIDYAESTRLYELHTVQKIGDEWKIPSNVSSAPYPDGAGDIDPFRSYSNMFTGETVGSRNIEYVWGRSSIGGDNSLTSYTSYSFSKVELGGVNTASLPQKVIDAYYMADGKDRNDSSNEYPYSEEYGFSSESKKFSGYTLNSGVHNMYLNREARFYASVGFSERFWPCESTTESEYKNKTITYYNGSQSGKGAGDTTNDDYPISGYVLTKFVHNSDAFRGAGASRIPKSYGIYRYAEALISYAEALNNLTTSHEVEIAGVNYVVSREKDQIKKYFNRIRYRCGLPGIDDNDLNDADKTQKIIERELMLEFLAENRRFYDIRRWGYFVDIEKESLQGMNIDGAKETFYQKVNINHKYIRNRVSDSKLMFIPLRKSEVRKSKLLDQNPGYGD